MCPIKFSIKVIRGIIAKIANLRFLHIFKKGLKFHFARRFLNIIHSSLKVTGSAAPLISN